MQTRILANTTDWNRAWDDNWSNPNLREVRIAVAYCSASGAAEIRLSHQINNVPVKFLVGLNDGVTDIFAREKLVEWSKFHSSDANSKVELRGTFQPRGRFHPKLYIFETQTEWRILIGSVNLTKSAFSDNTEAAVEWVFPRIADEKPDCLKTFESWWNKATEKPLKEPNGSNLEMAKLGLEARLVSTMKKGVLVDVEALLFPARGHFSKDVFDLGTELKVEDGLLLVKRSRQAQVLLIGSRTYGQLEGWRDEAHKNNRELSFSCLNGLFVPETAWSQWKITYTRISNEFSDCLSRFSTDKGRLEEKKQLKADLPQAIRQVWKLVHGTEEVPAEKAAKIEEDSLLQFDKKAPYFHSSVKLKLLPTPHPFPNMSSYAKTSSVMEIELYNFAQQSRPDILRDWMQTLIKTTRDAVMKTLDELAPNNRQTTTYSEWRNKGREKLELLNFYEDAFCVEAISVFECCSRQDERMKQLQNRTKRDLEMLDKWPQMPFEDVLRDFAERVGWKAPDSEKEENSQFKLRQNSTTRAFTDLAVNG